MPMMKVGGLFAIIPATVLLTLSFFVLLSLRNLRKGELKTFGYSVAVLLWISAALVFGAGVYKMAVGRPMGICPKMKMGMHGQMPEKQDSRRSNISPRMHHPEMAR